MATVTKKKPVTPVPTKKQEVAAVEVSQAVARVKDTRRDDIIRIFAEWQSRLGSQMAPLGAEIQEKVQIRDDLDTAIAAKQARLSELGLIESEAITLDDVKGQRLAAEAELEAYRNEQEIERDREEAEYQYNLARKRKEDADRYADNLKLTKDNEAARAKTLAEGWAAREKELKAAEDELKNLRDQVAKQPETIKAEVARAEAILRNTLTREFEHKSQLTLKDCENAKLVLQSQVNSLEADNKRLTGMIADLQSQVSTAMQQVKEISSQAVQAASGQQALAALQSSINSGGTQQFGQKR